MRIVVDCEFTQLNANSKLISMALVAEDGREIYFELSDSFEVSDCSDFVKEHVLPQLSGGDAQCTIVHAQRELLKFLDAFENVEILTDAPQWDWEFFCDLVYVDGKWPGNVSNKPLNLISLYNEIASDVEINEAPELPHHALLDARLLVGYYLKYIK